MTLCRLPGRWLGLAVLITIAGGCATSRSQNREGNETAPSKTVVKLEPVKVVAQPDTPDGLEIYDAETLFNRGREFLDNRYYADARIYFQKLLDEFPESSLARAAHYNLGVVLMQSGDPQSALMHFEIYLKDAQDPADRIDASFKRGACLAMLGQYPEVIALFDGLLKTEDLEPDDYIEANVDSGIGYFMTGDRGTAEYRFRQAVKTHDEEARNARLESRYFHAQALFYLAEIERLDFADVKLVLPHPGKEEEMSQQLERKCERLLSAQYKYLLVIRTGHPGWAGAAGYKVGTLYEDLHKEMTSLPVPADLDEDQADIYRREMRKKVAVLVHKAIRVYQNTMDMARRTGSDSVWIEKTQHSLERMQELMREAEAGKPPDESAAQANG